MNLNFEFFNENNFTIINLCVLKKNCKDIIKHISQKYKAKSKYINIYENNNLLKDTFNKWKCNNNYIIFIDKHFVNIIIKKNNKTLQLPQLELDTKIEDIKNILSIKGDIFFKNKKLDNKNTLLYYKINNNTVLTTYELDVLTSTS
jgi:hypothetical protein